MKRTLLELYGLAVCFFTVACAVIVLGMAIWDIVSISAPNFSLSGNEWEKHQTDADFREALIREHRYDPDKDAYAPPTGPELTAERERSYSQAIRSHSREALQSLLRNCIILSIDIVLFAIHWGIASRARKSNS